MRTPLLLVAAAIGTVAGCAGPRSTGGEDRIVTEAAGDVAAVEAVLDDFHAAAAAADGARYFAHFAPDGVFVGTDETERWTVGEFRAFAEPYFSKGKGWEYHPVERHVRVSPAGDVAWFDERLVNEAYGATRGSGVLRRIDGAWRIEQYVLSFPIPNDVARDVVERIRAHGSRSR